MARILVVDDNPAICQVMECCLPDFGHSVVTATDGDAALATLASEGFDLALLDVDMPLMSGIELCVLIKRAPATQALPVIMMTGRPSAEVQRAALEAGAFALLGKPFTWDVLIAEFERHLPARISA